MATSSGIAAGPPAGAARASWWHHAPRPGGRTRRDRAVDIACLVLAVAIGALSVDTVPLRMDLFTAANVAVGAAMCVALWWRRRWPVELALIAAPASVLAPTSGGAALILVFSLAVHRPARITMIVAGLHVLMVPPYVLLHPDADVGRLTSMAFGAVIIAGVVAWGMYVRARRALVASLTERAERAEAEQALRAERARLGERERIAREMHDVLAHRLSLLSLHAGVLEYRTAVPPEDVRRAAGIIRTNAHTALEELRAVIGALRHDGGDAEAPEPPQPTLVDLPRLVDESRQAGMRVHLECALDDPASVPASIGRHAYRVAQEGLTNARKHAPGCAVAVQVAGAPEHGLRVEVVNPYPVGRTPAHIPGARAGITGLSERVALAGGRLEHGRTDDGDHRLSAWMPWPT